MLIVEPSATLLSITPNAEQLIERCGRTCYKSECQITPDSAGSFVRKIMKLGHLSVIEHAVATIKFVCDRGVCYSEDTDVLTRSGWKSWPEVSIEDEFITLNSTNSVEYQRASQIIKHPYDGKMYNLSTSLINLCVTPNHKMYVRKFDTQAAKKGEEEWQLLPVTEIVGKRVEYKRNASPIIGTVKNITIPNFCTTQKGKIGKIQNHTRKGLTISSDVFAEFLGYWLAEGSLDHHSGSSYNITLYQNEGTVLRRIETCVEKMGFSPQKSANGKNGTNQRIRFCSAALYHWLEPYKYALKKRVARDVLNTFSGLDLKRLLLAYIDGDGSTHCKNGHQQAFTISRQLADDLQEVALKCGWSATVWEDNRIGEERKLSSGQTFVNRHVRERPPRQRPGYVVSIVKDKNTPLVNHGRKTWKGKPHENWVDYNGFVYCATVPNHVLYVRRNNRPCWSGNSHELVRHRLASYSQESTRYVSSVNKRQFQVETEDEAAEAYHKGSSMKRVSERSKGKFTEWDVYKILDERGIKRRPLGNRGVIYHDFFDTIDAPVKAYFLGLIQADGSHNGNQLVVTQSDKVSWFVKRLFRDFLRPSTPVCQDKGCNQFNVVSKQMCSALVDKGVIPNKSHDAGEKEAELLWNAIPKSLIPDFLRGFMDGDGGIRFFRQRNPGRTDSCNINWAGSKELLQRIAEWIKTEFNYSCVVRHLKESKQLHRIMVTQPNVGELLCHRMYANFVFPYGHPIKTSRAWDRIRFDYGISSWGDPQFQVIAPPIIEGDSESQNKDSGYFRELNPSVWKWGECVDVSEDTYTSMLATGQSPQIARSILPNCLKTEIATTANLREWRHILTLRTSKSAHPQIKEVMAQAAEILKKECPTVFEDI